MNCEEAKRAKEREINFDNGLSGCKRLKSPVLIGSNPWRPLSPFAIIREICGRIKCAD